MKLLKIIVSAILPQFIFCVMLSAQRNTLTSGGTVAGTGGSLTYSIGQADFGTATSSAFHFTEGMQQPYEILTTFTAPESGIFLSIYPNPTTDKIILETGDELPAETGYRLFNAEGKNISVGIVTASVTSIDLSSCAAGIYFLKIQTDTRILAVYKIIKK